MAASTWSQGSACPPGNHGIKPDGSCASAIDAAEATRSLAVSTPGSSGADMCDLRLVQIDHETFSNQRVQRTVRDARRGRLRSDVPDEHAVIETGQDVVALDTDGALQPPVRRVQPVCVVRAIGVKTNARQLRGQLTALVDAYVPAGVLVVLVRQGPADTLRKPARHGDGSASTGLEHTGDLAH